MLRTHPSPADSIMFHLTRMEQAANNSLKECCKRIYNLVMQAQQGDQPVCPAVGNIGEWEAGETSTPAARVLQELHAAAAATTISPSEVQEIIEKARGPSPAASTRASASLRRRSP